MSAQKRQKSSSVSESNQLRTKKSSREENNNLHQGGLRAESSSGSDDASDPGGQGGNLIKEFGQLRDYETKRLQKEEEALDAKFSDKIYRHQSTSNSYHATYYNNNIAQAGRPRSLPPNQTYASDPFTMTSSMTNSYLTSATGPPEVETPPGAATPLRPHYTVAAPAANYGTIQYVNSAGGPYMGGSGQIGTATHNHQRQLSASAILSTENVEGAPPLVVPVDKSVNLPLLDSGVGLYWNKNEDVPNLMNQLVKENKIHPNAGGGSILRSSSRTSDTMSVAIDMEPGSGNSSTAPGEIPYIDESTGTGGGFGGSGWVSGTAGMTGVGEAPHPAPPKYADQAPDGTTGSLETADLRRQDAAIVFAGNHMPYAQQPTYYAPPPANEEIELRSLLSRESTPQEPRMNGMDSSREPRGGLSPDDTASEPGQGSAGTKGRQKGHKAKAASQRKGAYDLTAPMAPFQQQLFGDQPTLFGDHSVFGGPNLRSGGTHSPPLEPCYRNLGSVPSSGRKKKSMRRGGVKNVLKAEEIEGHQGDLSIDKALEFVEGKKASSSEDQRKQKNNKTPRKSSDKNNGGGKKEASLTPVDDQKPSSPESLGQDGETGDGFGTSGGARRPSKQEKKAGDESPNESPKKGQTEEEKRKEEKDKLDLNDLRLYGSDSFVQALAQNPDLLDKTGPASVTGTRSQTDEEFVPVVTKKHKKKVTGRSSLGPTPRSMTPPLRQAPDTDRPPRTRRRSNEMPPVDALPGVQQTSGAPTGPAAPNTRRKPTRNSVAMSQTTANFSEAARNWGPGAVQAPNLEDLTNFPGIGDTVARSNNEFPGLGSNGDKMAGSVDAGSGGEVSAGLATEQAGQAPGAFPKMKTYANALLPAENRIRQARAEQVAEKQEEQEREATPPQPEEDGPGVRPAVEEEKNVEEVGWREEESGEKEELVEELPAQESVMKDEEENTETPTDVPTPENPQVSDREESIAKPGPEVPEDVQTAALDVPAVPGQPIAQKSLDFDEDASSIASSVQKSGRRKKGEVSFEDTQFFAEEEEQESAAGLFEFGDFQDLSEESGEEEDEEDPGDAPGLEGGDVTLQEERREVTEKHVKLIRHFNTTWTTSISKKSLKFQAPNSSTGH